jgi:hypothetical protein
LICAGVLGAGRSRLGGSLASFDRTANGLQEVAKR